MLSVGGFLGLRTHLVAVAFDSVHVVDRQMHLSGPPGFPLKALLEFRYVSP
jgi:hypothetical protein